MNILAKIFGTQSDRDVKRLKSVVEQINALEPEMQKLTDDELKGQTEKFRQQLKDGAKLEDLIVPAFATVREASRRFLKMRDFDVQLIGGLVLADGAIAEMKTGEGKTLVATLPVYLHALEGKGVHVVTVNDYLGRRDSEWMGKVYKGLGLTVGALSHEMDDPARKKAYDCDITYGTNTEFGFDYLRDNMKGSRAEQVQRGHHFAVVDEVDSILIDEARTPLIISGPSNEDTAIYSKVDKIVPFLKRGEVLNPDDPDLKTTTGDYIVDEKYKTVELTDDGITHAEELLGMNDVYDQEHMDTLDHVSTAIRAHECFKADVDYVIKDGEIVIVDEFTGRLMPGRRWNKGLHPAIEAKEGLTVQPETQTFATVTIQNYFRMYDNFAGMTGTAMTEAEEFGKIYNKDVIAIPTNKPSQRHDLDDLVFRTEAGKTRAMVKKIEESYKKGQPILVGTVSIEKSEELAGELQKLGVPFNVLNAKMNEAEAAIVAQAGRKGAVTISTNMAGRGTDIMLGGNPDFMAKEELVKNGTAQKVSDTVVYDDGPQADGKTTLYTYFGKQYSIDTEVLKQSVATYKVQTDKEHDEVTALGGLFIMGTERHDSRRVDNQLRGRAGRQGDPGESRFYISLEDHLARIWGGDRLKNFMGNMGMEEDEPIESRMVSRAIEKSQTKVEEQNYMARKNLLEYDDVMNMQRKIIYTMRDSVIADDADVKGVLFNMADQCLDDVLGKRFPEPKHPHSADWGGLAADIKDEFGIDIPVDKMENMKRDETKAAILDLLDKNYADKVATIGEEPVKELVRMMMRDKIDELWRDHLYAMDYLKEGIGLQGYGQKDPLLEYKKQAYEMFVELIGGINAEACRWGFHLRAATQEEQAAMEAQMAAQAAARGQFPAVANQFTHAAQTDETRPEGQQAKKAPDMVATPAATNGNPPSPPTPPTV